MKMIPFVSAIKFLDHSLAIVVDDDWLTYAYPDKDKECFLEIRPTPKNPIVFEKKDNELVGVNEFNELILTDTNGHKHTIGILQKQILEMASRTCIAL